MHQFWAENQRNSHLMFTEIFVERGPSDPHMERGEPTTGPTGVSPIYTPPQRLWREPSGGWRPIDGRCNHASSPNTALWHDDITAPLWEVTHAVTGSRGTTTTITYMPQHIRVNFIRYHCWPLFLKSITWICRVGVLSALAAYFLAQEGFKV